MVIAGTILCTPVSLCWTGENCLKTVTNLLQSDHLIRDSSSGFFLHHHRYFLSFDFCVHAFMAINIVSHMGVHMADNQ